MRDCRKLIVWQKAHDLALATHRAFKGRSTDGSASIRNQLVRAAASIPANIAEGCGKRT
jgi:four helix bundle protein